HLSLSCTGEGDGERKRERKKISIGNEEGRGSGNVEGTKLSRLSSSLVPSPLSLKLVVFSGVVTLRLSPSLLATPLLHSRHLIVSVELSGTRVWGDASVFN